MNQALHRACLSLLALALLAACGAAPTGAPTPTALGGAPRGATMQLAIAASELTLGTNRFPVGLIVKGTPINDPRTVVRLRFAPTVNGVAGAQTEAAAVYRGAGLPVGVYVAYPTFGQAGDWTVIATVQRNGETTFLTPMRFTVVATPSVPDVGARAIPSENLTSRDQPDLSHLTSDIHPDPRLYQHTVAEALAAHKPTLVAFATPGYCKSATCGPNLQVIKRMADQFGDTVQFIHIEVYPYPFGDSFAAGTRVPAMGEWHLETEPWTFLLNANGIIQARYEGGITPDELTPALTALAAGQPVPLHP